MDRARVGWYLALGVAIPAALLVPAAVGAAYGVPLVGLVVGIVLLLAIGFWMYSVTGFDWFMPRTEFMDVLTDEDTAERTATGYLADEDAATRKPTDDPTAWDR